MIKKIIHKLFRTSCQWEFRMEPGEEEHGINKSIRYCKLCNCKQHAFYYLFGNTGEMGWRDLDKELDKIFGKL